MARQKIPRELQEIAALLKHPGIDLQTKQQIIDQLTPDERKILGCAQLKPASQPETSSAPTAQRGPAPLKLVTSWPVQVQELELLLPGEHEFEDPLPPADEPELESLCETSSSWRLASVLASGAAIIWPVVVIVGSILLLVAVGYQVSAAAH